MFRAFALPLAVISIISFLALIKPVVAAPPDNPQGSSNIAQGSGVTLEKYTSSETVLLGQVVTYTITIKNNGQETINPTLTDELPKGLSLQTLTVNGIQTTAISATIGKVEVNNNTIVWSGTLAKGEKVNIFYPSIPPTTSTPGKTLVNVASLTFGKTTLEATATISTVSPDLNPWRMFINFIAKALVFFDTTLEAFNVPYAFGFAIILFTVLVRGATFPLNLKQIQSSRAMQELQPKMKELQEKYKNDKEKLAQEQMALYKEHGVNPVGGCLPMLVQMPIWFALYRSLIQLSREGLLTDGFFWIPSLSGPVADYSGGIGWLWPLPPTIGWPSALAYLVMPVLLVVSQLYTQKMMMPPSNDPQQASMQSVMKFMPLMFGYFALIVPSGLTLYWFTSNILALAQQYFTKNHFQTVSAEKSAGTGIISAPPIPINTVTTSTPLRSVSTNPREGRKNKNAKSKRKSKRKR